MPGATLEIGSNAGITASETATESIVLAATRGAVLAFAFLLLRVTYHRWRGRHGIGLGDVKLVNFTTGVIGPGGDSAWIEPEKGAWAVDSNELAEGRIIARIRTKTVHKPQGYGPNWWTWWWVYQDTARKAWHGVLLSDSMQTRDTEPVSREFHPLDEWKQSIARWKGSKWGTCDNRSCCSGP